MNEIFFLLKINSFVLTIRRSVEYIIYNELKKMNNVINIDKNNTLEKMIGENNEPR